MGVGGQLLSEYVADVEMKCMNKLIFVAAHALSNTLQQMKPLRISMHPETPDSISPKRNVASAGRGRSLPSNRDTVVRAGFQQQKSYFMCYICHQRKSA